MFTIFEIPAEHIGGLPRYRIRVEFPAFGKGLTLAKKFLTRELAILFIEEKFGPVYPTEIRHED